MCKMSDMAIHRQELMEKYPFIVLKEKSGVEPWREVSSTWIDEFLGSGWEKPILNFCEDCSLLFSDELLNCWHWIQFKEKFGCIVLYSCCDVSSSEVAAEVEAEWKEKGDWYRNRLARLADETWNTCVDCGAVATERDRFGWIITRCKQCADAEEERLRQSRK